MARTVHLNDSFFGRNIGTIGDDGSIRLPDGIWGERVVGHLEKDGIYIPDGLGRKKVIDISPLGRMYLVEDAGLFTRGTWVGSIDADGRVSDANHKIVAELRKGSNDKRDVVDGIFDADEEEADKKKAEPSKYPPKINVTFITIIGVALGAIFAWVVSFQVTPTLFHSGSIDASEKVGLAVILLITTVVIVVVAVKSREGVLATLASCLTMGTLAATLSFAAYILIADPPVGVGEWFLFVFFMPFVCFCWAAAGTVVVALPIIMLKAITGKRKSL